MKHKVGIIGHARCGSSAIRRVFSDHPEFELVIPEPFGLARRVSFDHDSQMKHFDELMKTADAFKHHVHQFGMETTTEIYRDYPHFKFVKMYRENILQSIVSQNLAFHLNWWQQDDNEIYWEKIKGFEFDLEDMAVALKRRRKHVQFIEDLDSSYTIVYEKFFTVVLNQRVKILEEMFETLGYNPEITDVMKIWIDPSRKQTPREAYLLTRNIIDVEREFALEYGSLFDVPGV